MDDIGALIEQHLKEQTDDDHAKTVENYLSQQQAPVDHGGVVEDYLKKQSPVPNRFAVAQNPDEQMATPAYKSSEPTPSLAASVISNSPLGVAAKGVGVAGEALSGVTGAIWKGMQALQGQPTASTQWIADAPKTVLEKGAELEQIPETGLKRLALAIEGEFPVGKPKWEDVVMKFPGVSKLPKDAQDALAKSVGIIAEPLADPVWFAKPFGKLAKGVEAQKAGMLEPNLGAAGRAGQRALITLGDKKLIQGQPVLNALGKAQTKWREMSPGYVVGTENPLANKIIEKQKSEFSNANVLADKQAIEDTKLIERHAALAGKTPEELNKLAAEYREPSGSQKSFAPEQAIEKEGRIAEQRRELAKTMPQELVDRLDEQIAQNKGYGVTEAIESTRHAYLKHSATPEFKEFIGKLPEQSSGGAVGSKPKSLAIESDIKRTFSNYTVNELNNLSAEGRLGETGVAFPEIWNQYKGKVFDDNIARLEAQRYLNNVKVTSTSEMLNALDKTFGKSKAALEQYVGKDIKKLSEFREVKSPMFEGGSKYFPKQIGDFLEGMQNPEMAKFNNDLASKFLNTTSGWTKTLQYSWYPKSAVTNYLSNLNMAFLNKGFSLINTEKALEIVAKDRGLPVSGRLGQLSDKTAIKSPIYGNISEKKLIQKANENRAIGMGQVKSEMATSNVTDWMRNNKISKFTDTIHGYSEDASRLPVFMTFIEDGYTWEGAAKATRDAIYDYSAMGAKDARNAKYIPFYRFVRLNTPKMIEIMMTDPARFFATEKLREAWNESQGQSVNEKVQSDYKQADAPWYIGKNEKGEPLWFSAGKYLTQTDLNHMMGTGQNIKEILMNTPKAIADRILSMINPAIKAPYNVAMNYDPLYDQPIERFKGEKKQIFGGFNLPSKPAYLVNQLRPFSEIRQATNQNIPLWARELRAALGFNIYSQDPMQDKLYKLYEQEKKIGASKADIRHEARTIARAGAKGDIDRENLAKENLNQAIKNLIENSQKVGGQFR